MSKSQLSAEPIEFPEKVFFVGQVVKCRVLNDSAEEGKIKLTLRVSLSSAFQFMSA